MRKLLITILLFSGWILSVQAQKLSEFASSVLNNYHYAALEYLKGEPIELISFNSAKVSPRNTQIYVSYVVPDTIWIKHKKHPKENKHFYLQYVWDGVPTAANNEYGFPIYVNRVRPTGRFIFRSFDETSQQLIVTDLTTNRHIKIPIILVDEIICPSIESKLQKELLGKHIYYAKGEEIISTTIDNCVYKLIRQNNVLVPQYKINTTEELSCNYDDNGELVFKYPVADNVAYEIYETTKAKDLSFLSLVTVSGQTSNLERYFNGDTMALYSMDINYREWDNFPEKIYFCYAYGNIYRFGGDAGSRDNITLLSPSDTTYLLQRKHSGEDNRLASARVWDLKNASLVARDLEWDTTRVIKAALKNISGTTHIDKYGNKNYEVVDMPSVGDSVYVIKFGQDYDYQAAFRFIFQGSLFVCDWRDLKFANKEEYSYIMRRGSDNYRERSIKAFAMCFADAIINEVEQKEAKLKAYQAKQIFISNYFSYNSGYGWDGIKLSVYNCFNKTIKYIYCTFAGYNYFNDPQGDQYGNLEKNVRCIGPIEPKDDGEYSFDDLFNNKNEVITSYRITEIKIIFTDNTSVVYKGWGKIKSHVDL